MHACIVLSLLLAQYLTELVEVVLKTTQLSLEFKKTTRQEALSTVFTMIVKDCTSLRSVYEINMQLISYVIPS